MWRSIGKRAEETEPLRIWTMAIEVLDLPKTDSYVEVAILDGGGMIGSSKIMHAEWPDDRDVPMSCWVFYIHHPKSGKKVVWDVGISAVFAPSFVSVINMKDREDYGAATQRIFYGPARGFGPKNDLPTQLEKRRGVKGSEIDAVLFSHAHW